MDEENVILATTHASVRSVRVFEVKVLNMICDLRLRNRLKNKEIRYESNVSILEKVNQNVVKEFGCVERRNNDEMVKRVRMDELNGNGVKANVGGITM